jgi:2-keto-myo-inositol isomerase
MNRREMIKTGTLLGVAGACSPLASVQAASIEYSQSNSKTASGFLLNGRELKFCLNTSTLRNEKLTLERKIEIASKAGYDGLEPWMNEIESAEQRGIKLDDLRKMIADAGLTVESAIGFASWIVDDEAQRKQGIEQAKRDMGKVAAIGGTRIAAPPAGATSTEGIDLRKIAERYHTLLEIGKTEGVVAQLEVWGFSKTLSRLSEVAFVVMEAAHPNACILPDVYHLYKGGTDFSALRSLGGTAVHVFHMNDYPAQPPRESIADEHRVFCGDGVAPLNSILQNLFANGFAGTLSLELFNREYWKRDADEVALEGLNKMKKAVEQAKMAMPNR